MNKTNTKATLFIGLALLGGMAPRALAEHWGHTTKPVATPNEPAVMTMQPGSLKAQLPTEEKLEIGEVFVAFSLATVLGLRFAAAKAKYSISMQRSF
jgi:hypothetical protein